MKDKKTLLHLSDILHYVQDRTNVDLVKRCRKRHNFYVRNIYYRLCRELTNYSLKDIGESINRGHATVINGLKRYEEGSMDDQYYSMSIKLFNELSEINKKSIEEGLALLPKEKIITYFERKITAIHSDYTQQLLKLDRQAKEMIENKAILSVSHELSKLSDADIHIFIETRLKPFILTR